ncbi:MAG: hypothetical protein ACJAZ3_001897 [Sphingobacteriales bacterium]
MFQLTISKKPHFQFYIELNLLIQMVKIVLVLSFSQASVIDVFDLITPPQLSNYWARITFDFWALQVYAQSKINTNDSNLIG